MEANLVGAQNLCAQFRNHLSIDRDDTSLDIIVSLTTTADAGIREELVQANRLIGIVVCLLVFNALLVRILGIGVVAGGAGTLAVLRFLAIGARSLIIGTVGVVATTLIRTIARTIGARSLIIGAIMVDRLVRLVSTARLVAFLTGLTIAALLTRLVAAAGLIAALTRLTVAAIVVVRARTIAPLLPGIAALQTRAEALGTEPTLIVVLSVVTGTLAGIVYGTLSSVNTRTR